ncbi:hypothetical protein JTY93_19705 [Pseudomonas hygromyciniae]|uniref:Dermonecrotic toxin N-terminal domain-containing protein n=1 Tax=Pseudomonas hygromyciniae TaxID=2812000 RepID=A0ABX7JUN4_9PSED|nr:DUF6543 domain-containing protein [Pseudomonas hygromyciniae]MBN0979988.1 hypothetical protein [Pseudomonas hygromyciniae]QSB38468.1 hypothetical protein JTY93_19705 [Pseudomonas hygromyciniae]
MAQPLATQSPHFDILTNAIPPWLGTASPAKRAVLAIDTPVIADWYLRATEQQHAHLKHLNGAAWAAQNRVDKALVALQSPETFGAARLQAALKDEFGIDTDVRTTYLQLYVPLTLAGFTVRPGAARTWSVSLLDAALHNFETDEPYEQHSGFSTQPTPTGQFTQLPDLDAKISIAQFTQLCRRLDIGAAYQRYLDEYLDLDNPVARTSLEYWLKQSHLGALQLALYMALLKNDLPAASHDAVLNLLNNGHTAHNDCPPLVAHDLRIMDCNLTGIVLFAPNLERSTEVVPLIAYIPDDPLHPVKHYPSSAAFMQSLAARLRATDYQQFFSRFVHHEDAAVFFADLNQRLGQVSWHPHTAGDPLPSWRDTPTQRPNLQFRSLEIKGDLFAHLFQMKLSKLQADSQSHAVSTARVDQNARWRRWALIQKIAESVLQVIAFVALPFIPPLGALMLAYTAYQVLDEAFEGIVDWAEGLQRKALEHALGLTEQLVQLGLFATGIPIATALLRKALPQQMLEFFESLHPVKRPDGQPRLWQPDLNPYRQDMTLPADARPDAQGLHLHNDKPILALDGAHYHVQEDAGRYFILHPTRPEAYRPQVMTNGQGAWVTELENPLSWDRTTLMRRLGYQTDTFSDEQLAQARDSSATHDNTLRKMHATQQTPPPLLADSLKRFGIDQQLQDFLAQLNSDDPAVYAKADPQTQLQLLISYGLWPSSKTLRVLDASGRTLWEFPGEDGASTVQVLEAQLHNGDLLPTLIEGLSEPERKQLLDEEFGLPPSSSRTRAGALRKTLARLAEDKRFSLFDSRYRGLDRTSDARAQKIIDSVSRPGLPAPVAEELLASASGEELKAIDAGTVPPRLVELAEWSLHEVRTTRAYEGLYLDTVENPDTCRLALHSLENLSGWPTWIRLEVRQYRADGPLLDAIGPTHALTQRTLVATPDGQYIPENGQGALFGSTDFYTAILQALPDSARDALKIHIGQGPRLKQAIGQSPADRPTLRTLLDTDPLHKPAYDPNVMRLRGGMDGYLPAAPEQPGPRRGPSLEQQLQSLRPQLTPTRIREVIATLQNTPGGAQAELTRLRNEYIQLDLALVVWESQTPRTHLNTGAPLSATDHEYLRRDRSLFSHQIRRAWRQETAIDHFYESPATNGYTLRLSVPLLGELPPLTARFEHISHLELQGAHQHIEVDGFLRLFPRLRYLSLRNLDLGELPPCLASVNSLNELILNNCNIRLTEHSQATISAMTNLLTLDLYNNPLSLIPNLEQMPQLQYVDLASTGIEQVPRGLLSRTHLTLVMLSNNRISTLPDALFDLPTDVTRHFDLSDNPLSTEALERVKTYFQRNHYYLEAAPQYADREQARRLFPSLSADQINQFIYSLPGDLAAGRIEMTRLEGEFPKIRLDSLAWANDSTVDTVEHDLRQRFINALEACWRRDTTAGDAAHGQAMPSYEFSLFIPVSGELPALRTSFSHVSVLALKGSGSNLGLDAFLQSFPALTALHIENYTLGELPQISHLPRLAYLVLDRCAIGLSPTTAQTLQRMTELKHLNLDNNPLARLPDFSQMPQLASLSLRNTGLTELPPSLINPPTMRVRVDLSQNTLHELTDEAFLLPPTVSGAFDLSANPLSPSTLRRVKSYCRATGEHWNADIPAHQLQRLNDLYPTLSARDCKRIFFELPGELEDADTQLSRLSAEYEQLNDGLQVWALNVPAMAEVRDPAFNENARAEEQIRRLGFKELLLRCWRRETEYDENEWPASRSYKLMFNGQFLGDLPALNARLEHVSQLELIGDGSRRRADDFLRAFPNLTSLTMESHALPSIPDSVFNLQRLRQLKLNDNLIRIRPDSVEQLTSLTDLNVLDLSDNPLGHSPDLSNCTRLIMVYLHNCELHEVPPGTFSLPRLRVLDLSDNLIQHLSTDLLEMPLPLNDDSDLSGNPLSIASIAILRRYYQQTGYELGVQQAMFDEEGIALTPPSTPEPMEE